MGDTWGSRVRLTIFGESHGPAIGIVIDGLPAGEVIDMEQVAREMARRAPGQSELATARVEPDSVEVLSGVLEVAGDDSLAVAEGDSPRSAGDDSPELAGSDSLELAGDDSQSAFDKQVNSKAPSTNLLSSTGSAICAVIQNTDARSGDYNGILRPGHADWTALLKHGGHADMRGGGHFSGRLTAALVFAGAVAKQVLARRGIEVAGRITEIGNVADVVLNQPSPTAQDYAALSQKPLPVFSDQVAEQMQDLILAAKAREDSVGGIVEVAAFGLPGGLGDPFFGSLESVASSLFFSIPAVKAVEFGDGFALAKLRGSQANDQLLLQDGAIAAASNHNGGVLGGITNGLPVVARLAIKPTASIGLAQQSVDATTMTQTELKIRGRHDPCIVPRAVPVAEAALALSILDCMTL